MHAYRMETASIWTHIRSGLYYFAYICAPLNNDVLPLACRNFEIFFSYIRHVVSLGSYRTRVGDASRVVLSSYSWQTGTSSLVGWFAKGMISRKTS